jgi:hypothetical protein
MATGQNAFPFTAYGETLGSGPNPSSIYAYSQASYKSLSVAGTQVIGINPTTVGTATCNAIVEILPTGLNVHGKKFLTDSTEAALSLLRT